MFPDMLDLLRSPWPTAWPDVFGRLAPLFLEVGFGNAQFLVDLARKHPEANVLGVEISLPSLRRGQRRIAAAGVGNAKVLRGDAKAVLWALCRPDVVDRIYVNFPDPWPKSGHRRRRLINQTFLHLAATRMKPGARLDVATDHAELADHVTAELEATPYFESRYGAAYATRDQSRLRTKYELTALAAGRICYYFRWRRNGQTAANPFANEMELTMPHVVIRSSLRPDQLMARFKASSVKEGSTRIRLLAIFQGQDENHVLVDTFVREEPVTQRVALSIRWRADGRMVVGLHELGFPRPTAGIHLAIGHLAGWLCRLDDETTVVQSNLQGDNTSRVHQYE